MYFFIRYLFTNSVLWSTLYTTWGPLCDALWRRDWDEYSTFPCAETTLINLDVRETREQKTTQDSWYNKLWFLAHTTYEDITQRNWTGARPWCGTNQSSCCVRCCAQAAWLFLFVFVANHYVHWVSVYVFVTFLAQKPVTHLFKCLLEAFIGLLVYESPIARSIGCPLSRYI